MLNFQGVLGWNLGILSFHALNGSPNLPGSTRFLEILGHHLLEGAAVDEEFSPISLLRDGDVNGVRPCFS